MTLKIAETLAARLEKEEGVVLKPYKDTTGHVTIGVGRNLTSRGISEDEAQYLLLNDINVVIHDLNAHLPWWSQLDDVRQLVLADMCFNLGITRLLEFRHTLSAIQHHHWSAAASGMRASLWARQVGKRADRLATMMLTGITVEIPEATS